MAFSTGTLTGKYEIPGGQPYDRKVRYEIIPAVSPVVDSAGHVVLSGRAKGELTNGTETVGGKVRNFATFTVDLPATNDLTLAPSGVYYTVVVVSAFAKITTPGVQVLAGQTTYVDQFTPTGSTPPIVGEVTLAQYLDLLARVIALEAGGSGFGSPDTDGLYALRSGMTPDTDGLYAVPSGHTADSDGLYAVA